MQNSVPIRLLIVEDQADDFELIQLQLADGGLDVSCFRVDSGESMLTALQSDEWDAILSDYSLPGFSGLEALELHQATGRDIPFLIISGIIGEESAVRCMKAGAHDLLLKGQTRLVPALRRELQEAHGRRAHRASEERYRAIVEQVSEGIWTAEEDGKFTFVNYRMANILRARPEDLIGRNLLDFVWPGSLPEAEKQIKSGVQQSSPLAFDLIRVDGQRAEVLITFGRLKEGGLLGTGTDVTELRALERKLLHSEKMEALGRLAAGMAHDFNNMLGVILGCSNQLQEELGEENSSEALQDLTRGIHAATVLVRQMLAAGRPQKVRLRPLHLNDYVTGFQRMLRKVIDPEVQLDFVAGAHPDTVELDPDTLSQVILNLALNARDALGPKGRISLKTENAQADDPSLPSGNYVVLSVSDNGHGMSEATMAKIFEPYFTTKGPTKGSGLGLASVNGIVRENGGHIVVRSQLGKGTSFRVYFPETVDSITHPQPPPMLLMPENFTVFLVDDAIPVLKVMKQSLRKETYHLLEADSAEMALERAREHAGQIDLLVTDLHMPGGGGVELAETLLKTQPNMKVLFTSGQPRDLCNLPDPNKLPHSFLMKPSVGQAFASAIRAMLTGEEAPVKAFR